MYDLSGPVFNLNLPLLNGSTLMGNGSSYPYFPESLALGSNLVINNGTISVISGVVLFNQLTDCKLATTNNLSATYDNGTAGVGATLTSRSFLSLSIDGVNAQVNDRILVWQQTDATQNGIYTVTATGGLFSDWVLTRADDFNNTSNINQSDYVVVTAGNTNKGNAFIIAAPGPYTVGTTLIYFVSLTLSLPYVTLTGDVTGAGNGTVATTLSSTGVTAGTYSNATITVDSQGRITTATNGSGITINQIKLTGSGTYVPSANVQYAEIYMLAAGGGGGLDGNNWGNNTTQFFITLQGSDLINPIVYVNNQGGSGAIGYSPISGSNAIPGNFGTFGTCGILGISNNVFSNDFETDTQLQLTYLPLQGTTGTYFSPIPGTATDQFGNQYLTNNPYTGSTDPITTLVIAGIGTQTNTIADYDGTNTVTITWGTSINYPFWGLGTQLGNDTWGSCSGNNSCDLNVSIFNSNNYSSSFIPIFGTWASPVLGNFPFGSNYPQNFTTANTIEIINDGAFGSETATFDGTALQVHVAAAASVFDSAGILYVHGANGYNTGGTAGNGVTIKYTNNTGSDLNGTPVITNFSHANNSSATITFEVGSGAITCGQIQKCNSNYIAGQEANAVVECYVLPSNVNNLITNPAFNGTTTFTLSGATQNSSTRWGGEFVFGIQFTQLTNQVINRYCNGAGGGTVNYCSSTLSQQGVNVFVPALAPTNFFNVSVPVPSTSAGTAISNNSVVAALIFQGSTTSAQITNTTGTFNFIGGTAGTAGTGGVGQNGTIFIREYI